MNRDLYQLPKQFVPLIILMVSIFTGCGPPVVEPMRICPGKEFAAESLNVLKLRTEDITPVKANGQCRLQYWAEEKKHKENFPVKLWFNPPGEVRLQGDVAWDPKGIVLGSNENEFWLAIRLKDISSYWWGQWTEQDRSDALIISPKWVLEALGIAEVGSDDNWSLSNEEFFDILTKRTAEGAIIKKIYVYSCDYTVRKIEYFDGYGEIAVVTELGRYKEITNGFFAPAVIKITRYACDDDENPVSITLTLRSIKSYEFSERQQKGLFARPEPKGFKHIYRITNGDVIEQSQ